MLKQTIEKIEFIDLQAQQRALGDKIPQVMHEVLKHGGYILGPEVKKLEEELAIYTQATDVITCSNGTDALRLLLLAYGVGPGDAVFVPSFTFASTAEVVAQANATPVFVDICPKTYNMDPKSLEQAIATVAKLSLNPKGIIAVDLFGMPANYDALHQVAAQHHLWLIADAAQSFGGAINGKVVGNLATTTATSFFPSKPLACYGDGGAIFTTDEKIGNLIRSLRNHGCGADRYDHIHIGLNSRLDTLQAAILIEKLRIFPLELARRKEIAAMYNQGLASLVTVPTHAPEVSPAWGLYSILCPDNQRAQVMQGLAEHQVPSNVYYRKPLHLQPAYAHFPRAAASLIHTETISSQVLSLPMHPYLSNAQVEYIIEAMHQVLG